MVFRLDRGTLRSPQTLTGGRLRVDAALTRAGVFTYRNADGSLRREYRPLEEVQKAESLATLQLAPFTDDHPPDGEVTAANARKYAVGSLGETVRMDGTFVVSTIVVNDAAVVAKMKRGKREVSCGYHCDTDATPGVSPEGEAYDVVQRNIRYNHVALVDVGRAGPNARIRMDAAEMVADATEERSMDPDLLKQLLAQVSELNARVAALTAERDAAVARADKAEGERDAERVRADNADKARTDAATGNDAAVRARTALIAQAQPIVGKDVDLFALSSVDIKRKVIEARKHELRADASEAYVDGVYDTVIRAAGSAAASLAGARGDAAPTTPRNDSAPALSLEAKARQKHYQESRDAWKSATPSN